MVNEHAEREHRLLSVAAEHDRRLVDDARQARELDAQREQLLVLDAQRARDALLADVQLQRDREEQREIDLRRDLYDLSRQCSRAAALEAELKCLKATTSPPTVAYAVVEVPVQSDDTAPPTADTVVQMSPSRPVTPIDNLVVQGQLSDGRLSLLLLYIGLMLLMHLPGIHMPQTRVQYITVTAQARQRCSRHTCLRQ